MKFWEIPAKFVITTGILAVHLWDHATYLALNHTCAAPQIRGGVAKGLESESRGGHAFFRNFFWFFVRITRVPKMDLEKIFEKKISKFFFRNFFSSSEHIFGQNLAITQGHFVGGKFFSCFLHVSWPCEHFWKSCLQKKCPCFFLEKTSKKISAPAAGFRPPPVADFRRGVI